MADATILRRNLSRLNTGNPFDTYNRQRAYMNSVLDREGRGDLQQRQNILRYFNLHDEAKPAETSYEDTTSGSISRAIDVGLEGVEQIYEGGRARLGSMLGDGEMVEDARKNIQASQLEANKISALQDRLNPNSKLGRFLFDATSSLPVTGAALLGSGVAAATLTTIGIPKLIAGFIGYGVVDAMLESNANFGDVLTHPRMMASLEKILGHKPTDAELRNINDGVGKIMVEKAGQSANRTALANLFNPTNILESRMKILGGKGFAGRLGRRAVVEGVEEGGQSVTSQFFREQAIGEVDPTQRRPVDKGQALYEGALGTVSGTVISAPQTYLGLRADRIAEQTRLDLEEEQQAQQRLESDLRQRTTELVATKDLQGVDEMLLGNEDQAQRDIILGTVQELKGSQDAGIAANARSYNRGTHIQKQEVAGDGQKEASTNDMEWQFREEYIEAKEAEVLGTADPRQQFIIRYAKNVKNPELLKFLKSWGIHQRNMKDKNQPNQKMDTGQPTGQQQQTQPQQQDQAPQQQQQQPATSEQIQAATDEIQQSLQQPAPPQNQVQQEAPAPIIPTPEADERSAFKEIQKVFVFVLGAGNKKTQVNMAITEGLNKTDPSRTAQVPSQSTDPDKAGRLVPGKFYDGDTKKQAAKNALTKLIDTGVVTPEQGVQLTNIIDETVLATPEATPIAEAPPVVDEPTTTQPGTVADAFVDILEDRTGDYVSNMGRVMEPDAPMEAEDAVRVLNKIGMSASDIEKIMAPMEEGSTITVGELQATVDKMRAEMDRTEAPVQPQAEPIGKTITEQDARSRVRAVLEDTKSSSLLVPSIRKHVIDLMREDPTIDDQALLNSQMIDSQLDLFNANLINEYLSALKEIEGIDTNAIPEKYINKYNIRKVLNKVFQSAGSAQSLRPTKLLNLGTAEESQARREFYKGMLTDPNFKGPDALDKSQLDKLEGGQAATDDKGMAFIDQSTEKVILQGGTIPEGTVIRVTTAGSKDRKGKMYKWTGRKPRLGDREPGMWYLVEFDGKDYRPIQDKRKLKDGETFAKDDDPFVRDDLWKEKIRVNPDNKRGENITAAYLQLRDNPDRLTISQGKTVYQLPDRGPGAEMPDPQGFGSVTGKLSDADKAMQDRIRDNNKTVDQFLQAQEAVNNNNTEKLSDLERANDELFEQNEFNIDSSFSDEGLTFVVSPEMNADPNFGALIKRLGFQELSRQPVGGAGDNIVTYGPPKPLRMPKFERDTTPQPREGGMPGEDPMNQGGYGQKMNKYSSLLKKRGSGKRTEEDDLQKAVDAMPDWLKNMIETNPKIAFLKKQEMIDLISTKTEKGNPAKDLTLPDSLMPKDTDTDRVVDAKRKIMDAIWEASSTEYATTNKGPGVRYSNLPKLWMVMSVLQNPGLASASIQKFLEFESASNMKNMSVEEMEVELMNLETMIDTQLPDMRELLQDAVMQEMLTTEELAAIEADYDSIMSDYVDSREALENRAGELTPEEFAKQSEALRVKFVEDATKALDTLDTSGATQAVKDSKTRVEELTREIAGLNNKFDTLSTQYEDAIQQAKENATQGIYAQKDEEAAPEAAPLQESDERYAGIPIVDQDQIKNANAQTVSNAANILNRQIRTRMKASGVKDANLTKDKDIKVWFEEWLDANPSKILGKRKWRGEDKLYVANMTNNAGDVSQWVIDLSGQWIEQNGTVPIEAGKQRGEVGFDVTDILGKDYKNPRQETGVNEFSDATIQTDQLGGQYNLSEGELGKLADQLKQTELWSTAPEGVSVDNIVNSSDLDWKSPDADADPRTLPKNHALRFFYDALQKSLVPKGQLKAKATKMYNDMKDISYDYLKGLASYGYNSDTAVEEARNALSTGLINQSQYGAIDSIAVRNDKNMGKKKTLDNIAASRTDKEGEQLSSLLSLPSSKNIKRWQSIKTRVPRMYYLDPSDAVFKGIKDMKEGYYILNSFNRWAHIPTNEDIKRGMQNERPLRLSDGPWDYADETEASNKLAAIIKGKSHKFEKSYAVKDKDTKAQVLGRDVQDLKKGLRRYKTTGKEVTENFLNGNIVRAQITDGYFEFKDKKGGVVYDKGKRLILFISLDEKNVGYEVEIDADSVSDFESFFVQTSLSKSKEETLKIDKELAQKDIRGDISAQVQAEFSEASDLAGGAAIKGEVLDSLKRRQQPVQESVDTNDAKRTEIERLANEYGIKDRDDIKIVITNSTADWGIPGSEGSQGTYSNGTAYFALDNIADVEEAQKTFVHEVGIHYGLPRIMSDADYAEFTRTVQEEFPNEVAAFNGDVEEFMADLAETVNNNTISAKFDKIVSTIMQFLRKIPVLGSVFDKMTMPELRNFARDAMSGLKNDDLRTVTHSRVMRRRKLKPGVFADFSDSDVDAFNMVHAPTDRKLTLENIKKDFKTKIVSKVFDALRPIETVVGKDAYILARLARRAEGVLTAMLEYGGIKVTKDKLTDPDKAYDSLDIDMSKKGLFEALKPLGSDAERKRFFAWIAYNRAKKLLGEGRESYFPTEMINRGVNFNRGMVYNAVTGSKTNRASLYDRISKDYEAFNKQVIDVGVKMGLLDKETAEEWDKQFYVPFYRVLEEDVKETRGPANYNKLVGQEGVQRLKGSNAPISNPFDNVLLNAFHIIDASLKNNAAINAIDSALKISDPATGVPIAKKVSGATKGSVRILRNGSAEHYIISDPLFLEALSSQHYQPINFPGMDFAIKAKRMFTYGTTLGLPFKVRNAIRDTVSTAGTTGVGLNLFDNFFGGIGRLKDKETKARMLVNGGYIQFGHLNSGNADFARKALEANLDRRYILNDPASQDTLAGAWDKYSRMARKVLGRYDDWGNELENANRASLFAKESARRGSNLLAAYHARDILDFSLSGSSNVVRMFNQLLPFTNARLQGLYKMGRATKDTPQAFFTVAGLVTIASLANYLAYKDDEDWKDREDWDKDTYYWFKVPGTENAFRIPTPHEFGFIGNVAWRSYAAVFDEDPIHRHLFAERMGALIKHELALDPTPQLIKPIKEIMTDRNAFTGRNIEGPALQRLSPTERKRLWTTQTAIGTSKLLNQVPWETVQLSPVQVEHLIKGYFGWVGQQMLFATDSAVRMAGDYPDLPGKKLTEYPLANEFFQTTPIKNTAYGNMFYEQLKELEQSYADIQLNKRIGDFKRANELAETNREKLYLRKLLNRKQDVVQELNNRIKLVQNDAYMTGDNKRQQIDRLEQMRNSMLRNVVRQYIVAD